MHQTIAARYYHTVKYLKPKQVFYQVLYRFYKPSCKARTVLSCRHWYTHWQAPLINTECLSATGEFTFLNQSGMLHAAPWNDSDRDRLWLYNVHYFDALNARSSASLSELHHQYIDAWLADNSPGIGCGWEPYPISLRVVNWVKWLSRYPKLSNEDMLISLRQQVESLSKKLEYHLLGNHLFANAKALVFAGAYFEGPAAERWLHKGLLLLNREIKSQFLMDGGHFERSPMYHALILWDLCDLVHLTDCSGLPILQSQRQAWTLQIKQALSWLQHMIHPDDGIAFFNDAALGIAPEIDQILNYSKLLAISCDHQDPPRFDMYSLPYSGYFTVYLPNQGKAILDVANVGPDHQPGHAHADTLSFEMSLFGHRFIVNSGTSKYGNDQLRQLQRSTKLHNTVCVNNKNSSDIWSGFRVGRRAYAHLLSSSVGQDRIYIGGSHDGYKHLRSGVVHYRTWDFKNTALCITDQISGPYVSAEARFYFHPDVTTIKQDEETVICILASGELIRISIEGGRSMRVEPSMWYPYFGKELENSCLVISFKTAILRTRFSWGAR